MTDTTSRVAVVTGGGRGIGWGIATRLQREGWQVVVADVEPGETATAGDGIVYRAMDVRDRDQVASTMAGVVDDFGRLDLLVNNAGIQRHRALTDLTWEEWSAVVDVNLHGVFNCLQAAGRIMVAAGGGIVVNITSVSAERGAPGRAPYNTTKAAIIALTKCAAVEWAAAGIRVNAVGPGYVNTGVFRAAVAGGTLDPEVVLSRIPARRLAEVDEVAGMVSFLASPDAAYMTGQTLFVDGGFLADFGVDLTKPGGTEAR